MPTAVVDDDRPYRGDEDHENGRRLPVTKCRERQRQPRQRRNGAKHLEQRIKPTHRPYRLPDQSAERDTGDGRQRVTERNPLKAGGQMPEQTLVDAAVIEERIEDQLLGVLVDARGRRQRRTGTPADQLPKYHQQSEHDQGRHHARRGLARHLDVFVRRAAAASASSQQPVHPFAGGTVTGSAFAAGIFIAGMLIDDASFVFISGPHANAPASASIRHQHA